MAQEKNKSLQYQYAIKCSLNNKQITVECHETQTIKRWARVYTEADYKDINNEYKKMKAAVDSGKILCKYPDYDGGDLEIGMGKLYSEYDLTLKSVNNY